MVHHSVSTGSLLSSLARRPAMASSASIHLQGLTWTRMAALTMSRCCCLCWCALAAVWSTRAACCLLAYCCCHLYMRQ